MNMRPALLATLSIALACTPAPPAAPSAVEPRAEGCEVAFATELVADGEGWILSVRAENLTRRAIDLELPGHCPAGPLDFDGLPVGYDVYSTCAMGACMDDPPVAVHLEPGATAEVTSASLAPGQRGCQPSLEPGTYELRPRLPELPVSTCTTAAVLEIAAAPAQASSADPGACSTDGDCMIYCPQADGCCSSAPCGCQSAVNKNAKDAADAAYAASCERAPDCPAMGCAYEEAHFARCDNGRCVAQSGW